MLSSQNSHQIKGLILAAGYSVRWRNSILQQSQQGGKELPPIHWKHVNKILTSLDLPTLEPPPSIPIQHKACAQLDEYSMIQHGIISLLRHGVKDVVVTVNDRQEVRDEIRENIALLEKTHPVKLGLINVSRDLEISYSVYTGAKQFEKHEGDLVVCYSDIIWRDSLLKQLLECQTGDIVVLVDVDWWQNYPRRRVWHDALFADLVYGRDGHIERIGEIVQRFENIPEWYEDLARVNHFEQFLKKDCIGEIVGLFKFSTKGRKIFIDIYEQLLNSTPPIIPLAEWILDLDYHYNFMSKPNFIAVKKSYFGDVLEYLVRTKEDLQIVVLETNGGWAEVDSWGDLCIVRSKFL